MTDDPTNSRDSRAAAVASKRRLARYTAALFSLVLAAGGLAPMRAAAQELGRPTPIAVSPGATDEPTGSPMTCPPFSWTLVADARRYDLAVLELSDPDDLPSVSVSAGVDPAEENEEGVAIRHQVPGGANHWLPSSSECLEPGHLYAWSVRAETGSGWSEWSEPLRFRTPGQVLAPQALRRLAAAEPMAATTRATIPEPAAISTPGLVESTDDGFRFPDGSVQTRAFKKVVIHAAVSASGDLLIGDALSASRIVPGVYEVNIGRPGIGCTAAATPAMYDPQGPGAIFSSTAFAVVTPGSFVVDVYTFLSNTSVDKPFVLHVVCDGPFQLFP